MHHATTAAASAAPAPSPEERLQALNAKLAALKIPAVTAEQANHLRTKENSNDIKHAFEHAHSEANWHRYLKAAVERAIKAVPAAPRSLPPPDAAPAPAAATSAPAPQPSAAAQAQRGGNTVRPVNFPQRQQYGDRPTPQLAGDPPTGAPASTAGTMPVPQASSTPIERQQFHVHNRNKAALCFEAGTTRPNPQKPNRPVKATVFVDGARAVQNSDTFDWDRKVRLMLTPDECLSVLAVVVGLVEEVRFGNHGEQGDKWFAIKRQPDSLYWTMGMGKKDAGGISLAVKIGPEDSFDLGALLTAQIRTNHKKLNGGDILALIRNTFAPMLVHQLAGKQQRT